MKTNSDIIAPRSLAAHRSASPRCACRHAAPFSVRGNLFRRLSALLPAFLNFGSRASLGESR